MPTKIVEHKGGRPKGKGIRVNVYLTPKENEMLEISAKITGMRKATAMREMAFSKMKSYEMWKESQPLLIALAKETAAQGINLNQIAKKLNEKSKGEFLNRFLNQTNNAEIQNAIATAQATHEKILELLTREK